MILAQARQKALGDGNHVSPADLGRGLAISRTKVAQVLRPLRLAPEVLNAIAALDRTVEERNACKNTQNQETVPWPSVGKRRE